MEAAVRLEGVDAAAVNWEVMSRLAEGRWEVNGSNWGNDGVVMLAWRNV